MARVIKAGQLHPVKPAEFNPTDMLAETAQRVEQARQEVENYLQAARNQAKQVLEEAHKQGFQAGYQEGLKQGNAEAARQYQQKLQQEVQQRLSTLMPALQQVIQYLREANDHWQGEWESLGIQLANAIASRIVHQSLSDHSEIARKTLSQCLSLVGRVPRVTIWLNPKDAESLKIDQQGFDSAFQGIGEVRIIEDATLTPGGCRVESEFGSIDAAIETQLDRIVDELLGSTPDK